MDGQGVGKILKKAGVSNHVRFHFAKLLGIELSASEHIDFVLGQAKNLPQFSHHSPKLKGAVCTNERYVFEPFEDVARHVIPIGPREIDVEIRRIGSVQVDEPLEIQIQLKGVHVGDLEQVGNQAVGAASSPHIEVSAASGIAGDVPIDQEIGHVALLANDPQFPLHPLEDNLAVVRIPVGQSFSTEAPYQLFVFVFGVRVGVLVVVNPSFRR